MNEMYLTAIIVCTQAQPGGQPLVNGKCFLKYRNIKDNPVKISNFLAFAVKFPGAIEVNFYYKKRAGETKGRFKEKIYLQ